MICPCMYQNTLRQLQHLSNGTMVFTTYIASITWTSDSVWMLSLRDSPQTFIISCWSLALPVWLYDRLSIYHVLTGLLALHALTGSDTTGKFAGIGKGTWVKRYLLAISDERFLSAMCGFVTEITEELMTMFGIFICSVFRPSQLTKNMPAEVFNISSTRYFLFRKSAAEGEKLPPSNGAFLMHEPIICTTSHMEYGTSADHWWNRLYRIWIQLLWWIVYTYPELWSNGTWCGNQNGVT